MPTHAETRTLPYSPEQMFKLVADVEHYPEFLPWCTAIRVQHRKADVIHADMMIGFKMFREKFTTEVQLTPHQRIDVSYSNGPFKYLNNFWIFEPTQDGGCKIDFYIEFEFRSIILQKTIGIVFNEAVQKMINAFEVRAEKIYAS